MSLGKRGPNEKQATPAGYPFYEHLNDLLSRPGFDSFADSVWSGLALQAYDRH